MPQSPLVSPMLVTNRATTLIRQYGRNAITEAANLAAQAAHDGGPVAIEFHEAVLAEVQRQLGGKR